jgi:hypothetical protein
MASSVSSSGTGARRRATLPEVDVVGLVTHVDFALMALVALFVLLAVPRILARFSRTAEWRGPHILRSALSSSAANSDNYTNGSPKTYAEDDGASIFSARDLNAGATTEDHHYLPSRPAPAPPVAPGPAPRRARSYGSFFPGFAAFLRAPAVPGGRPISQLLILLIYFIFVAYALVYKSSPFADGNRAGYVAVSQLPILIALAIKNNPAGMIIGLSYEKVNYIHRFAGRCAVFLADLHAAFYIYRWSMSGTVMKQLMVPFIAWGLVGLVWFNLLWLCSLEVVRTRAYNLFKTVHVLSAVFILISIYMHFPRTKPFLAAAAIVYGIDTLLRLFKTRLVTGTLTPCGSSTRLTLPLGAGWRAGHHLRIRVLSTQLGALRWIEAHPFTAASAPDGSAQLELLIQPAGTWTTRLHQLARGEFAAYESSSGKAEKALSFNSGVPVRVVVEGPYGGVGHARLAGCTGALIVAGGSGLSFALGVLYELAAAPGRIRHAQLVWTVTDPAALGPHLDALRMLLKKAEAHGLDIRVRVHYTRALMDADLRLFLPPGVSIRAGRPPLPRILHSAGERALRAENKVGGGAPSGFWVGACGPTGLSDSVARAVSGVDPELRTALGGVELHREMFGM